MYDESPREGRWVHQIVDANGERVVETDAGYYPPKQDDAELIVRAVNLLDDRDDP